MKKKIFVFLFCLLYSFSAFGKEKLLVVTTLPGLKSITEEVGGDRVTAVALAKGYEDPHNVSPTLKLMSLTHKADMFVEIGLSLELWSERVLDGARNAKIRVGQKGYVLASEGVALREVPKVLSRAGGDLHPYGNPHIWTDPLNGKIIARNIAQGLTRISPDDGPYFKKRLKIFLRKISEAMYGKKLVRLFGGGKILDRLYRKDRLISFLKGKKLSSRLQKKLGVTCLMDFLGGWVKMTLPFRGKKIIFYHQSWIYFTHRFGLKIASYVEAKPGISPSQEHRAFLVKKIKREKISVIAITNYYDTSVPNIIASKTGAKVVVVPAMTEGVKEAKDYISFITILVRDLSKAYANSK